MNEIARQIISLALTLDDQPKRDVRDAVLDLLAAGPVSGTSAALILRRRTGDVYAVLRLLASEGRIARHGQKWSLTEAEHGERR